MTIDELVRQRVGLTPQSPDALRSDVKTISIRMNEPDVEVLDRYSEALSMPRQHLLREMVRSGMAEVQTTLDDLQEDEWQEEQKLLFQIEDEENYQAK